MGALEGIVDEGKGKASEYPIGRGQAKRFFL